MANRNLKWWRDLLIIPLFVGLIIAIVTFGLPRLFEKDMELSYTIDGPTIYLDQRVIGSVNVKINDVPTSFLSAYKIRLWNSGGLPLKNLPVRFVFNTDQQDFIVFSIRHETKPEHEFGEIKEEGGNEHSERFVYELLNANDEDIITFLTNSSASLTVYAKTEGLTVKQVQPTEPSMWLVVLTSIIAALIGLLTRALIEKARFRRVLKSKIPKTR